jgi:hypothetical protein
MQQTGPVSGPAAVAHLSKLEAVIRGADSRRSFKDDPEGTLRRAGIDRNQVSESVIATLHGMGNEELDAVLRFHDELGKGGFKVKGPGGKDGGTVSFF